MASRVSVAMGFLQRSSAVLLRYVQDPLVRMPIERALDRCFIAHITGNRDTNPLASRGGLPAPGNNHFSAFIRSLCDGDTIVAQKHQ